MTELRTCAYEPCSKEFVPVHPRQRFCTPTHRANQHYVDNPEKGRVLQDGALRCVADHPLDEVRDEHEKGKREWTLIVREHLNRTLAATGYVSAADFEALGIPPEHSNLANAQMGGYASAGYIEAISFRRWSTEEKPSRKSGKYWIYRLTPEGRKKLAGLHTPNPEGSAATEAESAHGAAPSTGRGPDTGAVPRGAGSSGSVQPSESETGVGSPTRQRRKSGASSSVGAAADTGSSPDSLFDDGSVGMARNSAYSMENA